MTGLHIAVWLLRVPKVNIIILIIISIIIITSYYEILNS